MEFSSPEEAREKASMMLGSKIFTKQTGAAGKLCDEVMICKRLFTRREFYFSITMDRHTGVSLSLHFLTVSLFFFRVFCASFFPSVLIENVIFS